MVSWFSTLNVCEVCYVVKMCVCKVCKLIYFGNIKSPNGVNVIALTFTLFGKEFNVVSTLVDGILGFADVLRGLSKRKTIIGTILSKIYMIHSSILIWNKEYIIN